mmetsp:Transcript_29526/g.62651  ORF Transcript_29526/g.62651 Transcript_29526/m.62651 type:complete len:323 (-) Transcript_29526:106-1074(-)|eukprot:CAMPEP_0172302802 /NCGR_PEP_ID=MMETSP1058-20130122/4458_1 /TAXON_ID=83371 /ORGANISM="Detonula confervacea, Strain CCMP 353" /LENGTH=322 /DNA_ID=CAMNT_0013013421 /DNA_START=71 /DNA_END=1039 /DNA_ORIENTATION=-
MARDNNSVELPINTKLLNQVSEKYYAVVDDFIPQDFADQLLSDAERLYSDGNFQQHYFQFGGVLLKKPNVFELDLSDNSKLGTCELGLWKDVVCNVGPSFIRRIDELDQNNANEGQSKSLSLQTDTPPAIKLQLNTGGGSFPWHYDNPGPPNKRSLTCVVYLNPSWKEGDGGEIVLCPFLSRSIVIPPLHRRAVFFYSDRILHRVLPSKTRRVCFTMWCNGMNANAKNDVVLSKEHLQFTSYDEAQRFFVKSPLQRVISRAVYSEEYLKSMLECIVSKQSTEGVTQEEEKMLIEQHEASVLGITKKLRPLIDEFQRRKYALE